MAGVFIWAVADRGRPAPKGECILAGVAYGPFDAALDGAAATFEEFRELLVDLSSGIDWGVAALHREPLAASIGIPFHERRPLTDVVTYYHDVKLLDPDGVLDAGPMQVLGPGHRLELTVDLEVEELDRGRRLVSIEALGSWMSDPESESAAIAHARRALRGLLPDREALRRLHTVTPPSGATSE